MRQWALSLLIEDRMDQLPSYNQWLGQLKDKVNFFLDPLPSSIAGADSLRCRSTISRSRDVLEVTGGAQGSVWVVSELVKL